MKINFNHSLNSQERSLCTVFILYNRMSMLQLQMVITEEYCTIKHLSFIAQQLILAMESWNCLSSTSSPRDAAAVL
jgi:hypothetical protein